MNVENAIFTTNGQYVLSKTDIEIVAGKPRPTLLSVKNTTKDIMDGIRELGFGLSLNLMDDCIYANGKPISNVKPQILNALYDAGVKDASRVTNVMKEAARMNAFHPIRSYLENLEWDGKDHIAKLASYVKDSHEPIVYPDGTAKTVFHAFLYRWLIGAVAKVYAQFLDLRDTPQNTVIVMSGPTGIGKSQYIKFLSGEMVEYFSDETFDPDHPEIDWKMSKTWIWELAELGATTRRKDVEALKHKLTQSKAKFRVPYGEEHVTKNTLASFIGTANPTGVGFLVDQTGNRRFAVVDVVAIDFAYENEVEMRQVWAQAVHLYKNGESYKYDNNELEVKNANNATQTKEQPIGEYVEMLFEVDATQPWKTEPIIIGELLAKYCGQRKDVCAQEAAKYLTTVKGVSKAGKPLTWRGVRVRKELFGDGTIKKAKDISGKDAVVGMSDAIRQKIFDNLQQNSLAL